MKTLRIKKEDLNKTILKEIVSSIKNGHIISFPTETVYGVGAYLFDEDAHKRLYELKKRPKNKGFILHISKIEDVLHVTKDIPYDFYLLYEKFFPGPLTIVINNNNDSFKEISVKNTIAFRMPDNEPTIKLINELNSPLVGTSANISNEKSPISADEVLKYFDGKIPYVIDSGTCKIKVPSTVLSLSEKQPSILRLGSISKEEIEDIIKKKVIIN